MPEEEEDALEVSLDDTPTPEEIKAAAPPVQGVITGTAIISPLAAIANAGPPPVPGAPSVPARSGRGRSSGVLYLSRAINCDFEPDKPDSTDNFSSKISNGQTEPGIYADKNYYDCYKTALGVVERGKSYGVKWNGNGKIARWHSVVLGSDNKPVMDDELDAEGEPTGNKIPRMRLVETINPPQNVVDLRKSQADSDRKAQERALAHAAGQTVTSASTGAPRRQAAAAQFLSPQEIADAVVVEDQSLVVDMNETQTPPPAPGQGRRQPRATVGPVARPVQPAAPQPAEVSGISLEDALANLTSIHAPEGANLLTVPTDPNAIPAPSSVGESFGAPPQETTNEVTSVSEFTEDTNRASVDATSEAREPMAEVPEATVAEASDQAGDLETNASLATGASESASEVSTNITDNAAIEPTTDMEAVNDGPPAETSETAATEPIAEFQPAAQPRRSKRG